jgi:hypothetical protein
MTTWMTTHLSIKISIYFIYYKVNKYSTIYYCTKDFPILVSISCAPERWWWWRGGGDMAIGVAQWLETCRIPSLFCGCCHCCSDVPNESKINISVVEKKRKRNRKKKHTSSSRHFASRARLAGTLLLLLLLLSRYSAIGNHCGGGVISYHRFIIKKRWKYTWGSRHDASRAPFSLLVCW